MAINRFNADEIDKDIWDSILNLIIFDRKTLEFSFNQKELDLRRWFFVLLMMLILILIVMMGTMRW